MDWTRLAQDEDMRPAAPALSLEAAKAHLNLDGVDEHDARVQAYVDDAISQVDGPEGIGVCLITQSWRLSLDAWPRCIDIALGPVQSVTSITYRDPDGADQTLASDQYVYDLDRRPLRIYPADGASWPALKAMPGAVKVTFVAGYGDTPDAVPGRLLGAMKLIVAHRFEDRAGAEPPRQIEDVLQKYRRKRVA